MCTAEGALVQLSALSAGAYAVLAAVEAALARSSLAGPLSGASHSAFRSAVEASAGGNKTLAHSLTGAVFQSPTQRLVLRPKRPIHYQNLPS